MCGQIFFGNTDAMNMLNFVYTLISFLNAWFSAELRHQLKCLRTLRRKYKRSPSNHNFENLCMAEEKFQQDVKDCKLKLEAYLINSYASAT